MIEYISRTTRKYLLSTQGILVICLCIIVYYYLFHNESLSHFVARVKVNLALRFAGQYDKVPTAGSELITSERSKASWELRKGNVGVFAIQGRRPHMEDRFNIVNDLEHTDTSIYGIFDGHGGEVRYFSVIIAAYERTITDLCSI